MGFFDKDLLDKARDAAQQAVEQAQLGIAQGQAKLDAFQIKRRADALLRDLGAAYYAELCSGGTQDAVTSAVAAVDRHVAAHGPIDTSPSAAPPSTPFPRPTTTMSAAPSATPPTGPATAPTDESVDETADAAPPPGRTGTYTLDDV